MTNNENSIEYENNLSENEVSATVIEEIDVTSEMQSDPTRKDNMFISVHAIEDHIVSSMVNGDNLNDFSQTLFKQSQTAKNTRNYNITSQTTEVINLIKSLLEDYLEESENFEKSFNHFSEKTAARLNSAQQKSESKNPNMQKPSDGALTIIFNPDISELHHSIKLLISKIDIKEYLERQNAKYEKGFPIENKTQKSCLINLTISANLDPEKIDEPYFLELNVPNQSHKTICTINSIVITDTNSKISAFWTNDFLELKEERTDLNNTNTAFDSIKSFLSRKLKKFPNDYTVIHNNLIGYFERTSSYKHEEMISSVIGDYAPKDTNLKIVELAQELGELPSKKKFDTHFDIEKKDIEKKFSRDIQVNDSIVLKTKSHIRDINNTIIATKIDDEKVLVIKKVSDDAYNAFKKEE
ncbi:hypothetical protein [Lysinibacillus sp. FSL P4-0201]|uniref:hypothetical protein n=1 Tax=Lysinibacillus sp. FSL P4-0201 TaxID=2921721 RepID=UPI00315AD003